MRARFGTIAVAIATVLSAPANAETYRNPEFGFSVEVGGRLTCRAAPFTHDHGIDLYLDGLHLEGGPGDCDLYDRPFIGIIGNYNVLFAPSAAAQARTLCGYAGRPTKAPPGLQIDGHSSSSCRVDRRDGWIEIDVVAQDWQQPGKHTELINYEVMLHTTPQRFDQDLALFRAVLKTIRIFKPDMPGVPSVPNPR
jgi:hypothetical protein